VGGLPRGRLERWLLPDERRRRLADLPAISVMARAARDDDRNAGAGADAELVGSLLAAAGDAPQRLRGKAIRLVAVSAWRMGEHAFAQERAAEAVRLLRGLDDNDLLSALITDGAVEFTMGHSDESRRGLLEARDLAVRIGDVPAESVALCGLAEIDRAAGRSQRAQRYAEKALAAAHLAGAPTTLSLSLCNLGHAMLANGADPGTAAALFGEALSLASEIRSPMFLGWMLDGLAKATVETNPEHAARLIGAANSIRDTKSIKLDPQDERDVHDVRARLNEKLGAARVEDLMAEAAHVRVHDASAYALGERPR
jgi:tetratricopeptide (TPR) repeat protein